MASLRTGTGPALGDAHGAAAQEAARAADEIDQELRQCAAAAEALAEALGSGRLSSEGVGDRLKAIVEEEPEILTVGVAYHPSAPGRLHAPAVTRAGESAQTLRLQEIQDYTAPEALW